MKKTEIIKETAKYYESNPRSRDEKGCLYLSDNGAMCAVGRCMKKKALKEVGQYRGDADDMVHYMGEDEISPLLLERYQGHDDGNFWMYLQDFHDEGFHWEEKPEGKGNNLTDRGKRQMDFLLKEYA